MKTGLCIFFLILMSGVCHCQAKCTKVTTVEQKPFPDLLFKAKIFYQMTVEYTMVNKKQTNYYTEYYDINERMGRVDILELGKTRKYYYYSDGLESFEITDNTCKEYNESYTPSFMNDFVYDWNFNAKDKGAARLIHGPSAMFEYALAAYDKDKSSVVYMGNSSLDIRGIPAQYWRRCLQDNLTADYYFSSPGHEDLYGIKDFSEIPLRVVIFGVDAEMTDISKSILPQNYEIISFAPFLDDPKYTFELPVGVGCGRTPRDDDDDIPSFDKTNLFVLAEAVYTDYSAGDSGTSYSSNFMYALDLGSSYLSYFYTPWSKEDGKIVAGDPISVVYDTKNKYVYQTTFSDGQCTISNSDRYVPQYTIPGGDKGYVSLSDSSIFYPNSEFYYLGDGVDRGYEVSIYEVAYPDDYLLGDRTVTNTVVTHYYLKSNEVKWGPVPVKNALTRIRLSFNGTDDKGNKMNAVLNFNLYVFSTQINRRARIFDITNCFRNEESAQFFTIGFPAEQSLIDQIRDEIPSIIENIRGILSTDTEITPARLPYVMVDFTDGVYVTLYVLERPPVQLDFALPKSDTTISGAAESQGITDLETCATLCLENENDCWGFSHCEATCFIGSGNRTNAKTEKKAKCQFYNRTMFDNIPTLETVRRSLEHRVRDKQLKLAVTDKSGKEQFLEANYIAPAVFGEYEELFNRIGMETNPRLKVVKVGSKLKSDAGEKVKNFGRLTYGECQRMCLDYKECETVSYCASSGECVLSKTHGEDIPSTQIAEDFFCNLLSRKFSDKFTRSPGNVLSQTAKKSVDAKTEEECAKACAKETSFSCLSFDHCPSQKSKGCRLHAVHFLDIKTKEGAVFKDPVCGHYSRKYSYDFKKQSNAKTDGNGILLSTNVTLEECAKLCIEYGQGTCHGFDICQDKIVTATACTVLTIRASEMKTTYNAICNHYSRDLPGESAAVYSNGTAAGVGILLFVIGCVLGALIVFGVAYFRVNRSR